MAPVSKTDIVNLALGHLKQRKIANLTENSIQAQEANRSYDIARREALRGADYGFCLVVKTLAVDATYAASSDGVYAGKWIYAYTYPSNSISIKRIFNETTADAKQRNEFTVVYDDVNNKKVILTDVYQALCEYTFDVQDTSLFDASFVPAFAFRLAYEMAPNLTGDDAIADAMLKLYNVAISEADRAGSYETYDTSQEKTTSSYQDVR